METLHGKTAIVTGGGSGIGKAIAEALIREGANVLIASRRAPSVEGAASIVCDVRKKADVIKVAATAKQRFGGIDILINNTGLGVTSKIVDCSEEDWQLVLDTNLTGTFLMTQAVLPVMIAQRRGSIINIASQAAKHGYPNAGPYCASKFGIVGLSEALQHEVREYGIHVHCLCPGLVQVPTPKNKDEVRAGVLQTEDLATAALFVLKMPSRVNLENIGLYHF
ncbi:MAG: SDR family NAD(P)-dependent oxidoreductase [Verrucomicrobiales bacterium]|nr:SDR family NAD(P)-dependent oxidoreductase [Verrucomicrobiales bacterium]